MSSNNIDSYFQTCIDLESEIKESLNQFEHEDDAKKTGVINKLENKIKHSKDYLFLIEIELLDMPDGNDQERYSSEFKKHNDEIAKLEEQINSLRKPGQEKGRTKCLTVQDLLERSLILQQSQLNSF